MNGTLRLAQRFADWLDIRRDEVRKVALSFTGAFLVIAFLILARSLREALYLAAFPVETLPYITASVALLSIPTVGLFARLLVHHHPKRVLMGILLVMAAGLGALWPFATRVDVAVVIFYLWTGLGTLLLTSGFWIVTSEYFAVRGAKRLYGLIGAGGTAGAMVMGNSLVWLTRELDLIWLMPLLIALALLLFITQWLLPRPPAPEITAGDREGAASTRIREGLATAWRTPHLRTLALIIFTATAATTLLDYQFKELVRVNLTTKEQLAGFFGAFYGWTGLVSLLVQVFLVARVMSGAGIAISLAVLPLLLLFGSAGLLLAPGLLLATVVRGGDNSLRKSLYRSVVEVLYVPVPSSLRRKTKTFIDSVVDSLAEGVGSLLIFLWVTLPGLPSRYLSVYVMALAGVFLFLSRRMGAQYMKTIRQRLREGDPDARRLAADARPGGRDLISGSFTELDLGPLVGVTSGAPLAPELRGASRAPAAHASVSSVRDGTDVETLVRALDEAEELGQEEVRALGRLLARDDLYPRVARVLVELGDRIIPHLARLLRDEGTDFVIRRRIPRVLALAGGPEAEAALLDALSANRFEVRYRSAISLMRRRRLELPEADRDADAVVWEAIRSEVGRDRPVWELQRVLDGFESMDDGFVARRVGIRGELSLEHTFRLLALVLEPEAVRAAFHGVLLDDERLKSFALEYLEQVLPQDIRNRLWPFVGDISERRRRHAQRPLDEVVSDLITTGATLFANAEDQAALRRLLDRDTDP